MNDRKNNPRRQGENRKIWCPADKNRHKLSSWREPAPLVRPHTPSSLSIRVKQTQKSLNMPGKGHTPSTLPGLVRQHKAYHPKNMRTKITLDDDIAAMLERLKQKENKTFKQMINDVLRKGLVQSTSKKTVHVLFHTRARCRGLQISQSR